MPQVSGRRPAVDPLQHQRDRQHPPRRPTSFAFPDAPRSSAAVIPRRVIAIAPAIPACSASPAVSQISADLGTPRRVKQRGRWNRIRGGHDPLAARRGARSADRGAALRLLRRRVPRPAAAGDENLCLLLIDGPKAKPPGACHALLPSRGCGKPGGRGGSRRPLPTSRRCTRACRGRRPTSRTGSRRCGRGMLRAGDPLGLAAGQPGAGCRAESGDQAPGSSADEIARLTAALAAFAEAAGPTTC